MVQGAKVTARNTQTGHTLTMETNRFGLYRFALLPPGEYTITVSVAKFHKASQELELAVGAARTVNFQLVMEGASEVFEVTAVVAALQTDNGNIATTLTQTQIANIPNPGNDLSYYAQLAPGVAMNNGGGYGNFATFGLPGTSNLFTVNGMNVNDTFFNLNNTGATNLTLGANDIAEATVVNNGYLGEYGGLAGSNVNFVTKSGTNRWHGNLQYLYNDDRLNANSWFNDYSHTPKASSLAQQYAGSFGGPIKKDKAFFFFSAEGLYVNLPTSTTVTVPTPAVEQAILANLTATNPSQVGFYNKLFSLWNHAPKTGRLTPVAGGGCGSNLTGAAAAFAAAGGVCANQFTSTASNNTHENMQMGRFDYNIGPRDRAYFHFRRDVGVQTSYTDPIDSSFNLVSNQSEYDAQLNETHIFGENSVNQFIASGMYSGALFNVPNASAALAKMPFSLFFTGGTFYSLGTANYFDQGRNVTQYQITDDFSHIWRKHDLKFGINFTRSDVSDWDINLGAQTGFVPSETLSDFFNGVATSYTQNFVSGGKRSARISAYGLGLYAQDGWNVRPNLKLTFALRVEHDSNPVCQTNCFSRFKTSFDQLDPSSPDNQTILTGQRQALDDFDSLNWQPRFGFAWNPFGASSGPVIRGGFGIFNDRIPMQVANAELANSPFVNGFTVSGVNLSQGPASASANNAAFFAGFNNGAVVPAVNMTVPAHSLHSPRYQEWNLEVQKDFGKAGALSVSYVGNHGIHELYIDGSLNAYDAAGGISATDPGGFGGLPLTAPDSNFGAVSEVKSGAISNYNGLVVSFVHRSRNLQLQFNYTWSHALDEVSNGGILPFVYSGNNGADNTSPQNPGNPYNLRYNYGNADYDIRHYASVSWVWNTPKLQNKVLNALASWTVSGTLFAHSGMPYTVVDTSLTSAFAAQNYGWGGTMNITPYFYANQIVPGSVSCGGGASACAAMINNFGAATTTWGKQRRNQLRGPSYFNSSVALMKKFKIPHWESGEIAAGAQFFNIFNHPNFDQPTADIASSLYGTIQHTLATPTSIYGSFLGADASPRQIQLRATLTF